MGIQASDRARTQRNLNPHAEARLAMWLWSYEYANEQHGGSMDFWDSLSEHRKHLCVRAVDEILAACENAGRAVID